MFATIMSFVLKWEGGYVNHPSDPGGATNMGITQKTLDEYQKSKGLPTYPVKTIKTSEVLNIYYEEYWNPEWEKLGFPLAACMMDSAVNHGPAQAKRFLEKCEGDYVKYLQVRLAFYKDLVARKPEMKVFEKGWNNRMADLRRFIDGERYANIPYAHTGAARGVL